MMCRPTVSPHKWTLLPMCKYAAARVDDNRGRSSVRLTLSSLMIGPLTVFKPVVMDKRLAQASSDGIRLRMS